MILRLSKCIECIINIYSVFSVNIRLNIENIFKSKSQSLGETITKVRKVRSFSKLVFYFPSSGVADNHLLRN